MFQGRQNFFSALPPVTKNLIIINFLGWLATIVLPKFGINLVEYLGLHYLTAKDFNAVQLVTYMFMHDPGSIGHVFFNMFSVFMFGRTLEMVWGSKRFLTYYMITGFGAGLVQELTWYISLHNEIAQAVSAYGWEQTRMILNGIITIGASGAVFGILLAFGMLFPNLPLYIMFIPIPIKAKYFVIFYGAVELFFGISNFSGDNIAHFAHLGGMLFGYIVIKYWRKKGIGNGQYF